VICFRRYGPTYLGECSYWIRCLESWLRFLHSVGFGCSEDWARGGEVLGSMYKERLCVLGMSLVIGS